jgi:Heterokaryon incompatibility protein (HET)
MMKSKSYTYDEIGPEDIRLLRLRPGDGPLEGELVTCRLLSEDSGDATQNIPIPNTSHEVVNSGEYDAVSYFWGTGEPTTHITIYDREESIYVNGYLPIKPNLEAALKTFRKTLKVNELQFFWIDAICIHQVNKVEKSAQIKRMAHIYKQAEKVRVWLGKATPESNIAMDFVQDLLRLDNIEKLSNDREYALKWSSFRGLMRSEWFTRRWIIQEIALAREATIYCGDRTVSWEEFKWAVSLFVSRQKPLKKLFQQLSDFDYHPDFLGELDALGAKKLVDISNNLFRKSENGEVIEHLMSLETLMSTLTMFEASTPHDVVYAILWLAHDATVGISRPAAMMPENAYTPQHSPNQRTFPLPPTINTDMPPVSNMTGEKLVESPEEQVRQIGVQTSEPPKLTAHLPPEHAHQGSGSRVTGFLKLPDPGRLGRARSNSVNSVASLRRAEEQFYQHPAPIQVSYDKSVFEVCKDFLEFAVMRSKSLDIICRPWAPSPLEDKPEPKMPSWIPHISGRPYELRPHERVYNRVAADSLIGTSERGIKNYSACGKTRAYNTDPPTKNLIVDRALVTKGFVLDTIEIAGKEATGGIIPSSWLEMVQWENPEDSLPQSFWRTIVADRDLGGQHPPPAYFPLACKWAFSRRTKGFHLNTQQLLNEGRCPKEALRFIRRVQAVVWDRKLAKTKGTEMPDGTEIAPPLLALVPTETTKGDLICVLHGCSVPVVLRKKESEVPERVPKRKPTRQPTRGGLKKPRKSTIHQLDGVQVPANSTPNSGPNSLRPAAELDDGSLPGIQVSNDDSVASHPSQSTTGASGIGLRVETSSPTPESSSVPLQKVPDDQYIFLGECYVHGMMTGEGYKQREDTKTQYREFWLV